MRVSTSAMCTSRSPIWTGPSRSTRVLGFELVQRMGSSAAFLSAGGYHHHIGLNTWDSLTASRRRPDPPALPLRHPLSRPRGARRRAAPARRGIPLDGASDHGVSEALYLRDPDGNGLELYWDRPRERWPRAADGTLQMVTERLDLEALLGKRRRPRPPAPAAPRVTPATRARLNDLRTGLLALHKALLDDAKTQYQMDRRPRPAPASCCSW